MLRSVVNAQAVAVAGPYSHAVWAGDLLYLSGQTPLDGETGQLIVGSIEQQTRRCLASLERVLAQAGLGPDDIVKCNVFLTDMDNFAAMNETYSDFFDGPLPARTTIGVTGLPLGARVEIEAVARRAASND